MYPVRVSQTSVAAMKAKEKVTQTMNTHASQSGYMTISVFDVPYEQLLDLAARLNQDVHYQSQNDAYLEIHFGEIILTAWSKRDN
jgi:hypothetical protein